MGLIYDFTRTGRSKLFATYARYYQNGVLAMINSQFSNVTRLTATRNREATAGGPGAIRSPRPRRTRTAATRATWRRCRARRPPR
ncbi:hypothetical protein ACN28S_53500 [Cystobacter fuscus]